MSNRLQKLVGRLAVALLIPALAVPLCAQSPTTFQYFYDDLDQLTKAIDSTGIEIDYIYDPVGNMLQVRRGTAPGGLAILDFTPQLGPIEVNVTIQGQNFSSTPSQDTVKFNGAVATVVSATTTTIVATVPVTATTGPISVTVDGHTANSSNNFTVTPVPAITSVNPTFLVSSTTPTIIPNFQVTGANLTGSTFSFYPPYTPPVIAVNSANINSSGTAATLNITVAPNILGSFVLVATNNAGPSSQVPGSNNTFNIIDPNGDADGDGLTNAVEILIGTNPLNPDTSGVGLDDGWQVFYGINPLNPGVAGQDLDGSGLTVLQDFQRGLSPRNPNLVPPAVSRISPANGASGVVLNGIVIVRFTEQLLTGVTLTAAQNAIVAAVGSGLGGNQLQIAAQTLQGYLNRTCCGNSVVAGTVTLSGPSGAVPGSVMPSSDGLTATFTPSQLLQANTRYHVVVNGVRDAAGNLMTMPFSSWFTTGTSIDQGPQIVSTSPINGAYNVPVNANVVVTFSTAMDPSTVNSASFTLFDITGNDSVPGAIQLNSSNTVATFLPSQSLPVGHFFQVTLTTAMRDLASGLHLAGNTTFGFSTGQLSQEADSFTLSVLNGSTSGHNGPTQAEADSLTFSLLNGSTSGHNGPTQAEADSLTFSLLNGSTSGHNGPTQAEADSLTFSLLNGSTSGHNGPTQAEADSLTFSLLNGSTSGHNGPTQAEADSFTFSLLNGTSSGHNEPTQAEADSFTFSLLNGTSSGYNGPTQAEADSLTFSLLNGEAPQVGAIVYEADSLTFSLHNIDTSGSIRPRQINGTSNESSGVAEKSSAYSLPRSSSETYRDSTGSGHTAQLATANGQSNWHAQSLSRFRTNSASQRTYHSSAFSRLLNRWLHLHSDSRPGSVKPRAYTPQPAAKNNQISVPASSAEVAACPASTASGFAIHDFGRMSCQ